MEVKVLFTDVFRKQFENLKPDVHDAVLKALQKLKSNPDAKSLRLHRLTSVKPPIWKIDVFSDRSWQISMSRAGNSFTCLSVCTHKEMDRLY